MKLAFTEFAPLAPSDGPPRGPFVKLIDEDRNARPRGRVRVRILDNTTNKLVAYPGGRVRYFGSEAAADDWIATQAKRAARAFRPRNYTRRP